jgi:hypothetical protein
VFTARRWSASAPSSYRFVADDGSAMPISESLHEWDAGLNSTQPSVLVRAYAMKIKRNDQAVASQLPVRRVRIPGDGGLNVAPESGHPVC